MKANILSEEKMRQLGFKLVYNKWYMYKTLFKDVSFNMSIDINTKEYEIDILDDMFCQPYDYNLILKRHPTNAYARICKDSHEKIMNMLQQEKII